MADVPAAPMPAKGVTTYSSIAPAVPGGRGMPAAMRKKTKVKAKAKAKKPMKGKM